MQDDFETLQDHKSEESFAEGEGSPLQSAPEKEAGSRAEDSKQLDVAMRSSAETPAGKSNLVNILSVVKSFLERFNSQPLHVEHSNAQIQLKYPKYLSKFSLLNLQLNDSLFRVTFLTQMAIFL